jgi:hypothetical protein
VEENMADLVKALTVPFAAGFIVQRLLELLDPFTTAKIKDPNTKKLVLGMISVVVGWSLAGFAHIEVFAALQKPLPYVLDIFFSGVFISAGTEGFNSLIKFANYKKEATKGDAADKLSKLNLSQLGLVNQQAQAG